MKNGSAVCRNGDETLTIQSGIVLLPYNSKDDRRPSTASATDMGFIKGTVDGEGYVAARSTYTIPTTLKGFVKNGEFVGELWNDNCEFVVGPREPSRVNSAPAPVRPNSLTVPNASELQASGGLFDGKYPVSLIVKSGVNGEWGCRNVDETLIVQSGIVVLPYNNKNGAISRRENVNGETIRGTVDGEGHVVGKSNYATPTKLKGRIADGRFIGGAWNDNCEFAISLRKP
jgi:hypothetical protein